jgi:deoxycytidylate deaminase
MSKHESYFRLLDKVAQGLEPVARARVAAFLVYKNEIIAVGYNKSKSHPFQKRFGSNSKAIYLHAEVDCIKNSLRDVDVDFLKKCTMYVLRTKRPDNDHNAFVRALSKPCEGCHRAINTFGIKHVYYTTDDGYNIL